MMSNTTPAIFVTTIVNNETTTVLNNDTTIILDNDTVTIVDSNYTITAIDNNFAQNITLYGSTDRPRTLNNHQDISEKTIKS
jgi:hypothetical protein